MNYISSAGEQSDAKRRRTSQLSPSPDIDKETRDRGTEGQEDKEDEDKCDLETSADGEEESAVIKDVGEESKAEKEKEKEEESSSHASNCRPCTSEDKVGNKWYHKLDVEDTKRAADAWEALYEVLLHFENQCLKDWYRKTSLKWTNKFVDFYRDERRPDIFNDLLKEVILDVIRLQQTRKVEEQWNSIVDILNVCGRIPEMFPLIEGLLDTMEPHIKESAGLALTSRVLTLGLTILPKAVTPIALRRSQFVENLNLSHFVHIIEALAAQDEMRTMKDIFTRLDRDQDSILSRKDLCILRDLRNVENEGQRQDPQRVHSVMNYLDKIDFVDFSQMINHAAYWSKSGCENHKDMFLNYIEPVVHKYIKARRAETGNNLMTVKKVQKPPVDEFIENIGESRFLYNTFIPFLVQQLADAVMLIEPNEKDPTSVGFEPYLSTLRWQILMQLVNNKVLVPTCQGLWDITSRYTGSERSYKYKLSVEKNGLSGWSNLSSRTGDKTFKISGSVPTTTGKYDFTLVPISDPENGTRYYVNSEISSDLRTLEGHWGTESIGGKMTGELSGVRTDGSFHLIDRLGRVWDTQTALISLLDKIIPKMVITDSQALELSALIKGLLRDKKTYVDNLMDLAFILVNPLLQISLLRRLCGFDRPWSGTEYLSLALIRVSAIAPFHWRGGSTPPAFEELFGESPDGALTLPSSLPKQELQRMFREHAAAKPESCLPKVKKLILGKALPSEEPEGCWGGNFIGIIINVLVAGHLIKKEAKCVANCLKATLDLPVNWVSRQLTDTVINIASQRCLDFEPAMRYPVCDYLVNRSKRDVWTHRRAVLFFRDSLFAKDVRQHMIWPRNKDALFFTDLAVKGQIYCSLYRNVPFKQLYLDAIRIYDEEEGEPFMMDQFKEKNILQRFERPSPPPGTFAPPSFDRRLDPSSGSPIGAQGRLLSSPLYPPGSGTPILPMRSGTPATPILIRDSPQPSHHQGGVSPSPRGTPISVPPHGGSRGAVPPGCGPSPGAVPPGQPTPPPLGFKGCAPRPRPRPLPSFRHRMVPSPNGDMSGRPPPIVMAGPNMKGRSESYASSGGPPPRGPQWRGVMDAGTPPVHDVAWGAPPRWPPPNGPPSHRSPYQGLMNYPGIHMAARPELTAGERPPYSPGYRPDSYRGPPPGYGAIRDGGQPRSPPGPPCAPHLHPYGDSRPRIRSPINYMPAGGGGGSSMTSSSNPNGSADPDANLAGFSPSLSSTAIPAPAAGETILRRKSISPTKRWSDSQPPNPPLRPPLGPPLEPLQIVNPPLGPPLEPQHRNPPPKMGRQPINPPLGPPLGSLQHRPFQHPGPKAGTSPKMTRTPSVGVEPQHSNSYKTEEEYNTRREGEEGAWNKRHTPSGGSHAGDGSGSPTQSTSHIKTHFIGLWLEPLKGDREREGGDTERGAEEGGESNNNIPLIPATSNDNNNRRSVSPDDLLFDRDGEDELLGEAVNGISGERKNDDTRVPVYDEQERSRMMMNGPSDVRNIPAHKSDGADGECARTSDVISVMSDEDAVE